MEAWRHQRYRDLLSLKDIPIVDRELLARNIGKHTLPPFLAQEKSDPLGSVFQQ